MRLPKINPQRSRYTSLFTHPNNCAPVGKLHISNPSYGSHRLNWILRFAFVTFLPYRKTIGSQEQHAVYESVCLCISILIECYGKSIKSKIIQSEKIAPRNSSTDIHEKWYKSYVSEHRLNIQVFDIIRFVIPIC
jgi:hypothetical protein